MNEKKILEIFPFAENREKEIVRIALKRKLFCFHSLKQIVCNNSTPASVKQT